MLLLKMLKKITYVKMAVANDIAYVRLWNQDGC